jgi:hypothetical protein
MVEQTDGDKRVKVRESGKVQVLGESYTFGYYQNVFKDHDARG